MIPKKRRPHVKLEAFNDSPIAWFAELVLASDRGDRDRTIRATTELICLGWTIRYRRPRPEAVGQGEVR